MDVLRFCGGRSRNNVERFSDYLILYLVVGAFFLHLFVIVVLFVFGGEKKDC